MNSPVPAMAWPALPDLSARLAWYRGVCDAYAQARRLDGNVNGPVAEEAMLALEARLGCRLPAALRAYHREIGIVKLGERLCTVDPSQPHPIQPLLEAFPGFLSYDLSEDEEALAEELIVFGDYLGNGNMFCFHRESGAVYYFDHDTAPPLTQFFEDVDTYLDALMILSLARITEEGIEGREEDAEELLAERFGDDLVDKWFY